MVIHRSPHSLYIVIYSDILGKERLLRTLFFHACLRRNPVRDKPIRRDIYRTISVSFARQDRRQICHNGAWNHYGIRD